MSLLLVGLEALELMTRDRTGSLGEKTHDKTSDVSRTNRGGLMWHCGGPIHTTLAQHARRTAGFAGGGAQKRVHPLPSHSPDQVEDLPNPVGKMLVLVHCEVSNPGGSRVRPPGAIQRVGKSAGQLSSRP